MKKIAFGAALIVALSGSVQAMVTYDWVATDYYYFGSTPAPSQTFSFRRSITLADSAVARGRIQLIGWDGYDYSSEPEAYVNPNEIIDFVFDASSADGAEFYSFGRNDMGINFDVPYWKEAYYENLYIGKDGPSITTRLVSGDGSTHFDLYRADEVIVETGGFTYAVLGKYVERVPEPGSTMLLLMGLTGAVVGRKSLVPKKS